MAMLTQSGVRAFSPESSPSVRRSAATPRGLDSTQRTPRTHSIIPSLLPPLTVDLDRVERQNERLRLRAGCAFIHSSRVEASTSQFIQLHAAVARGTLDDVREAVRANRDNLNDAECGGLTPLHKAAFRGDVTIVQMLMDFSALINSKDAAGQAPLHVAALQLNTQVVQQLIRQRASVDITDLEGLSPARASAARCHKSSKNVQRMANVLDLFARAYDREFETLWTLANGEPWSQSLKINKAVADASIHAEVPEVTKFFGRVKYEHQKLGHRFKRTADGIERVTLEESRKLDAHQDPRWPDAGPAAIPDCRRRASLKNIAIFGLPVADASRVVDADPEDMPAGQLQAGVISPSPRRGPPGGVDGDTGWRYKHANMYTQQSQIALKYKISQGGDAEMAKLAEGTMPVLMKASHNGDVQSVQTLLRQRASPDVMCPSGSTISALHIAASSGKSDVVHHLLRQRSVPFYNFEGRTPLRCVVSRLTKVSENKNDLRQMALVLDALLQAMEREFQRLRYELENKELMALLPVSGQTPDPVRFRKKETVTPSTAAPSQTPSPSPYQNPTRPNQRPTILDAVAAAALVPSPLYASPPCPSLQTTAADAAEPDLPLAIPAAAGTPTPSSSLASSPGPQATAAAVTLPSLPAESATGRDGQPSPGSVHVADLTSPSPLPATPQVSAAGMYGHSALVRDMLRM